MKFIEYKTTDIFTLNDHTQSHNRRQNTQFYYDGIADCALNIFDLD